MKYKYRLFVPSLVMTSLLATNLVVSADEFESENEEIQNDVKEEEIYEVSPTELNHQKTDMEPSNDNPDDNPEFYDSKLEEADSAENYSEIENEEPSYSTDAGIIVEVEDSHDSKGNEVDKEVDNLEDEVFTEEAGGNDSADNDTELKKNFNHIAEEEPQEETDTEDEPSYYTKATNTSDKTADSSDSVITYDLAEDNTTVNNENDDNQSKEESNPTTAVEENHLHIIDIKADNQLKRSDAEPVVDEKTFSLMSRSSQVQDLSVPVYTDIQSAARIKKHNNSGLYTSIIREEPFSTQELLNNTLFINQQADYNDTTYYQVLDGLNGTPQGWMKAQDLNLFHHSTPANHRKEYYIHPENNHRYLLEQPWGTSNQRVRQLNQFNHNTVFKAEKSMKLGALNFLYGKVDNDYGWIQNNHLQDLSTPLYSDAQWATRIKSSDNPGLYDEVTNNDKVSAQEFSNTTLFIDRQADYNGMTYYRVLDGLDGASQGWMKAQDLNLFHYSTPASHRKEYYVHPENNHRHLLEQPWGTSNQRVRQLNQFNHNAVFKAEKSMKLGALNFLYGKVDNDYGWIQSNHLQDISIPLYSAAQQAARIKSTNNSGIYNKVTNNDPVSAKGFLNTTLFIDRQADYNGTTYYRVLDGLEGSSPGWVKSQDLSLFHHSAPSTHREEYYIYPEHNHRYLLEQPWGTSNQRVRQLNQYNPNAIFNAEKSMKLGALNFLYGKIGNDYGWVQDTHLTLDAPLPHDQPKVTTIRYNQSLEQVLNIQMNLNAKPQAWVNGGGWRNATRSEVRNFLDTSHQQGGAWDYTFLNLNQSQGISASVLNRQLLSNRGILTNRGSAFAQAARTHGVNEVYLISHAVLETGHGTSQLAQGVRLDRNGNLSNNGTKYYNMYGVGAVDNNALLGGARYAQRMGWDTPEKAIIGGASFVSQNYFNRGQNTLYAMRWNPRNPGTYQYATDVNWAYATARNLESYYRTLGVTGKYFTRYIF